MSNTLKAYAMAFASFLIGTLEKEELAKISRIVLFGSVARGEGRTGSDIDLFVETHSRRIKGKVKEAKERFYDSENYRRYWRLLGIKNEIRPIVGEMKDWPVLRKSIVNDGIVLYGKFIEPIAEENPHVLIWWEAIKNQSKRVLLSKQIYGYTINGKEYQGLVGRIKGCKKLGPNTLIVPLDGFQEIKATFEKNEIQFRQRLMSSIE